MYTPAGGGIGLYANNGNKEVWLAYRLCVDETNYSSCENSNRVLQPGDVLSFEMKGTQAYGEVGFILASSPDFSANNFAAKNNSYSMECYLLGLNNTWKLKQKSGFSDITTSFSGSGTQVTYDVSILMTSSATAKVTLTDGTSTGVYDVLLESSDITHIIFYLKDDWNGSSNQDFFFGSDGNGMLVTNTGSLALESTAISYGNLFDPIIPTSTTTTQALNIDVSAAVSFQGEVNISGTLDVSSGNSLTLEANSTAGYSQLKFGTFNGTGTVVQEQYLASSGHHGVSSPMSGGFGISTGLTSALYSYDAGNGAYLSAANTTVTTPGEGYFAPVGANGFQMSAGTFSVTGTPITNHNHNLGYATTVASGGSGNGWNLIGNPYTCGLDWSSVSLNNVNDAFYIWDPSSSTYLYYVNGVNPPTGPSAGSQLASSVIPPLQAFWVQASSNGASVVSSMAANGTTGSSPTFYKSQPDNIILTVTNLSDTTKGDVLWVKNVQGTSNAFNGTEDAWKMTNYGGFPNIYTYHNGDKMAINATDFQQSSVIPVGLIGPMAGVKYVFRAEQFTSNGAYSLVLEDKHLKSFTNLCEESYTFTYGVWSQEDPRFSLHIHESTVSEDELNSKEDLKIFQTGSHVVIQCDENSYDSYQVVSQDGRSIAQGKLKSSETRIQAPDAGIYVVKVSGIRENMSRIIVH